MPNITKQIIRELIETLDVCGAHHPDLLALLDQQECEPVAIVERFRLEPTNNIISVELPVSTKLYTHPPAPRKVTAEDVTDEMLASIEHHEEMGIGKKMMAKIVNAYLTLEKK